MTMTKKNINRMITGIFILFLAVPFIFLAYINNNANRLGLDFQTYLTQYPLMTIQLLAVFLLPISAFILKSKWDNIKTEDRPIELYISVILMMISQFIMGNTIYGLLFTILFVIVTRYYTIQINSAFSSFKNIRQFFTTFSGEIVIVSLSVFLQLLASRVR